MEPVSLILAALAVGAGEAGGRALVSEVVKDGYAKVKTAVQARLVGRNVGEVALAQYEEKPEVWGAPLEADLVAAGVSEDAAVLEAARQLMELVDPSGAQRGKYQVDLRGAQGVQVGDHNTQTNTFGSPPAAN